MITVDYLFHIYLNSFSPSTFYPILLVILK